MTEVLSKKVGCAALKLDRALSAGGCDPISGYSYEEIRDYLLYDAELDPVRDAAEAALRARGLLA